MISVLVRRGADFAAAEDAVQDALVEALRVWPRDLPRDPRAWLIAVAWRRFLDAVRSEEARRRREHLDAGERGVGPSPVSVSADAGSDPVAGPDSGVDDTLWLYFLCSHPVLPQTSAIALTLRAVGGLSTRQIARAFLVPEATVAQRISRAKRSLAGKRLDRPGDLSTVLRILYLVFNEGYTGEVDLAVEAIRLTRQLAATVDEPEVQGLLALMLLHHARRPARIDDNGELVPLAEQDRGRWDSRSIEAAIAVLQAALTRDRLGEYQAQAAIAALHADAPTVDDTDWVQIVEWYDELLAMAAGPVAQLGRAVAVGHADGPQAGLADLKPVPETLPRRTAAEAYLHELAGDCRTAATMYAQAAAEATSIPEQRYLSRRAAELGAR